jgi:aspartate racemase
VKHIGILAHSFEGASLSYRTMCLGGIERLGPHMHPEITLSGIGMHHMMEHWDRGEHAAIRTMFVRSIDQLAAAGADFFVCPDNTAHMALESPGEDFSIPCLHIGEVVADQALRDGRAKVGILGTNWTMTGSVYPGAFGRRGIDWAVPNEEDRTKMHRIIFDELTLGMIKDSSRDAYVEIIEKMKSEGCDAVALVCTEIPLLITAECSPLPILDSTRLQARAAVAAALGERPMPAWRGGPI